MEDSLEEEQKKEYSRNKRKINKTKMFVFCLLFLLALSAFGYFLFLSPPKDFVSGTTVRIGYGASLKSVSMKLEQAKIIRSQVFFEALVILYGGEFRIVAGDYLFEEAVPVWQVALRMAQGGRYKASIVVAIPEGFDIPQIADIASKKLANFDKEKFIASAKDKEGYLFPDTYYFFSNDGEDEVLEAMSKNFENKMKMISSEIDSSGKSEREIIVMASIIERESKGDSDREFISGILWKRISINIPLQVDAAPDTYKTKGLPASPISNPGLETIRAAIHPKTSSYLYYLHDKNGNIHYAKTFKEHRANISKYLIND